MNAFEILENTSRTFFIPITRLPPDLMEAVASAYLCMRAIDEIEDHPELNWGTKQRLLNTISQSIQAAENCEGWNGLGKTLQTYRDEIPEVSQRLNEWLCLSPTSIAPRIWDATAAMADRMAHWASRKWQVETKSDLDHYTFSVAGTVGLMLSDIWSWYDGTRSDRMNAIGFGRGLQAVNILRNKNEDYSRGVNFYPNDWNDKDMVDYAIMNLELGSQYLRDLPDGPAMQFCKIPLNLAYASINALVDGRKKLSRAEVLQLIDE